MKKLFIVLAAAFMAVNVNAAKGDMVISGTVGFESQNEVDGLRESATGFTIAPSFTYFLSDKFGIGGEVGFSSKKVGEGDAANIIAVGVFGRYYFMKSEKFGVFGQAGLGVGFANEAAGEGTIIAFAVNPGIQYFINKKWSIEASLADVLTIGSFSPKGGDAVTDINLNVNPFDLNFNALQLTLNYHF